MIISTNISTFTYQTILIYSANLDRTIKYIGMQEKSVGKHSFHEGCARSTMNDDIGILNTWHTCPSDYE